MSPDRLSVTLAALADPTRRGILARLTQGDATVGELAAPYDMSLAAVSKHLKVLEGAGLISRGREAQWRPCHLEAEPLADVWSWLSDYRRFWERSLDRLGAYLETLQRPESDAAAEHPSRRAMTTTIDADSAQEAVIVLTRIYDAPRLLVWEALTNPTHVANWYGGEGFTSPVCEMDVRPDGLWRHVMRAPNGMEFGIDSVFIEVVKPERLVWTAKARGERPQGAPPISVTTVTLEELGENQTRWTLVASFASLADRDLAASMGFGHLVSQGAERMEAVLQTL